MGKMKRIVYIIATVLTVSILVGGVVASADYKAENSTRVWVYEKNAAAYTVEAEAVYTANVQEFEDGIEITENGNATVGESDFATDGINENGLDESSAAGTSNTPVTEGTTESNGEKKDGTGNPFEALFNTVKAYATEIFCAMTFVGSLILAYAYKCGLIPIIKGGIGALSATVSGIRESAERGEKKTDELGRAVSERLKNAESTLDGISENLSLMATKLDKLEADGDEKRKLRIVMNAEVDMLYSIFMTSALPQYQKDEIGERIAKMREVLADDEG